MRGLRKRLELAAAVAAAIWAAGAGPARAQGGAVFCVNCSSEYTQWLSYLEAVAQLEKQAAMLQIAIRNATAQPDFMANKGLTQLQAVADILKQAKSLSAASANLDGQFAQKFKDYNGYVAAKLDRQTMAAKYQQWSADAQDATKTSLKAAGLQAKQIEGDEEQALLALEAKAKAAQGTLDAQQTAMELAIQSIRQLQKLRQLVTLNMQLAANYGQIEADRQAARQAAWEQFSRKTENIDTTNGKYFRGGEYRKGE